MSDAFTATPTQTVRIDGIAKQAIETGRNRLIVAGCLVALGFCAVAVRVVELSAFRGHAEPKIAASAGEAALAVGRADITDRNGVLLATSLKTPSLYADPKDVLDAEEAAAELVTVLRDLNPAEVAAKLRTNRRFVWLKRSLTPTEHDQVNRLGIPGLYFQNEWRRVYPQGALTGHVVGYTNVDDRGLAGVERTFDDVLRARTEALPLSIDLRVQHVVRDELARQIELFEGIGGTGVVLDVDTGETVAMVSLPDFNPNVPAKDPKQLPINQATLGVYEMGSTFKIFNTAMALDMGATSLSGGFDATHPIRVGRFTINDYHAKKRWLSTPEIFIYSSNIGSVKMALEAGTDVQRAYMSKFGLLNEVALELPENGRPMTPRPWREINTMTVSFGHGIAVSPMHLVSGVATVVNGGIKHPATLIRTDNPGPGERVLKEQTSIDMRKLMRLVVENGTGRNASAEGYLVGGKTGTAEKAGGRAGYKRKKLLSSFVGAFPINAPRYVVLVMVDEPKGQDFSHGYATGGWVAAPAVKRIISRSAPFLGVAPVDEMLPEIRRDLMIQNVSKGGKRLASF